MERIRVNEITKSFKSDADERLGALARFVRFCSGKRSKKRLITLDKVSLTAHEGETIGIIGPNGSGKSNLLRIIAGIYTKDSGTVATNGRIVSLSNVGLGLKRRLALKDNVYMFGALFGLTRAEIKDRFDEIVAFSELEGFIDTKIFKYSLGMMSRLALSIGIHCDPEIFLLDEVFESGDEEFKNKCLRKIRKLAQSGTTVIIVSHYMHMVERFCERVIWLEQGRIIEEGKAKDVVQNYLKAKNKDDLSEEVIG